MKKMLGKALPFILGMVAGYFAKSPIDGMIAKMKAKGK